MKLFVLSPCEEGIWPCVRVDGRAWALTTRGLSIEEEPFICVSYTWGHGTVPSPFHENFMVSDHTVPALVTVIKQRPECRAIWIDAFCIPYEADDEETRKQRHLTLESMGYIYSQAADVVAVLSSSSQAALERIKSRQPLQEEHLDALEREDWISRAWTYQEAANSQVLSITCDDAPVGLVVNDQLFFSYLGGALRQLGVSKVDRARYPRLDAFEELLADCCVANYQERSALQVMSIMSKRVQQRPDDHFYAMIGAITTELASSNPGRSACAAFMSLCENKGDYSFIFAAVPRDTRAGWTWRPVEHPDLPPVLSWHSWGDKQPGRWLEGHFYLDDVFVFRPEPLLPGTRQWIQTFLTHINIHEFGSLEEGCFKGLEDASFDGCSEPILTTRGFFFPCWKLQGQSEVEVLVSSRINWAFGAPALLKYKDEGKIMPLYCPGALFGPVGSEEVVQSACLTT